MKEVKREQTEYNKLVGRIGNEFYFCDYIFIDTLFNKPFKGATGTVLTPVTNEEYEATHDPCNRETLERVKEIWQMVVTEGKTKDSLIEFTKDIINNDGDDFFFDLSGYDLHEQIRDAETKFNENDYPIFTCVGGGRCFDPDMKFDKIYDKKLWEKIKKIETQ